MEQVTPGWQGSWTSRLQEAAPKIFDFTFPIWKPEYLTELEVKILRHYFNCEIGLETVALWKFYMEMRLCEIMPYFNQLYATVDKQFDYLLDVDVTEDFTGNELKQENIKFKSNESNDTDTTNDTTFTGSTTTDTTRDENLTTTTTGSPTSHTMHNDFPQAPIQTKDYATYEDYTQNTLNENINSDTSLTDNVDVKTNDATKNIVTTNQDVDYSSTNDLTGNRDNTHKLTRKGLNGGKSYSQLLLEYRQTLINIDMMVIESLSDLFMTVY